MKRLLIASFLLLVLAALPLSHLLMAKGPAPHKPNQLCHNGHLIHPNAHAEEAHRAHGDCPVFGGIMPSGIPCECPT